MARLTAAARKAIPKSEYGVPSKAPSSGSYPMPDRKHAAVAKAYAERFASPAVKAKVDAKANRILGKPLGKHHSEHGFRRSSMK